MRWHFLNCRCRVICFGCKHNVILQTYRTFLSFMTKMLNAVFIKSVFLRSPANIILSVYKPFTRCLSVESYSTCVYMIFFLFSIVSSQFIHVHY